MCILFRFCEHNISIKTRQEAKDLLIHTYSNKRNNLKKGWKNKSYKAKTIKRLEERSDSPIF